MLAYLYIVYIQMLIFGAQAEKGAIAFQQHDYKMDFERADAVNHNPETMKIFETRTFKYNRTCTALNVTFEVKVEAGNDIEVVVQAYTFLSNEYRLFPMRFQINLCDGISRNYVGFSSIGKCEKTPICPIAKGRRYILCNFTPDETQLPPLIPDGRYMVELQGVHKGEELFLLRGYGKVYRPIRILRK